MGIAPRTTLRWLRRLAVAGALVASGCGGDAPAPRADDAVGPRDAIVAAAPTTAPAAVASPAARRPALPRRVSTLAGALRRARIAGRISDREYRSGRRIDARARAAVGRLSGARRAELARVIATLDGLAVQGTLTSSRLPVAVLTVRRNLEVFTTRAMPRPGERMTFGKDPVVFQHWSGKGMQFHPLATAGKLNALARPCLKHSRHCRPHALRRAANRLAALASDRSGYAAWEYLVAYGSGRPPWVSGMAQATAAQALARSGKALGSPRFSDLAVEALGAFDQPPPSGVAVAADGGRHYLMYSFAPDLRILNGFLQSVIGLHDVAELTGSGRAERLFREGEIAARAAVAAYDTGAWSLYAGGGRESTLGYHELVQTFLGGLCRRAHKRIYCGTERRFARYRREAPRVHLAQLRGLKAGRATRLSFTLSKVSRVTVRVASRRGPVIRRHLTLARGRHVVAWRPAKRGRYRVRIEAVGPEGRHTVRTQSVRVRPVKKPKKHPPVKQPSLRGEVKAPTAALPD